jgi:hypothetical protein
MGVCCCCRRASEKLLGPAEKANLEVGSVIKSVGGRD